MINKKITATALKYDKSKPGAPKIVANGKDLIAEKILLLAKENNIPIKKDENLAEILSSIEINEEIPLELYSVVAEIFAFLYNVNKSCEQDQL